MEEENAMAYYFPPPQLHPTEGLLVWDWINSTKILHRIFFHSTINSFPKCNIFLNVLCMCVWCSWIKILLLVLWSMEYLPQNVFLEWLRPFNFPLFF
jgi:hypothetical protein